MAMALMQRRTNVSILIMHEVASLLHNLRLHGTQFTNAVLPFQSMACIFQYNIYKY